MAAVHGSHATWPHDGNTIGLVRVVPSWLSAHTGHSCVPQAVLGPLIVWFVGSHRNHFFLDVGYPYHVHALCPFCFLL